MNPIFKYNGNTKCSTKDLTGGHNRNNFSLLNAYLDKKEHIQLLNIFKDHHIVAKSSPTAVDYDERLLSNDLCYLVTYSAKYKTELNIFICINVS